MPPKALSRSMTFWTRSWRQLPVNPCTTTRHRSDEPGTWTALIGTPSDVVSVRSSWPVHARPLSRRGPGPDAVP